jgi:Na+/melibiose symporter-like transporter
MMLLYIVPPTIVSLLVAAVMWRFPLGEEQHREIRRVIEERAIAGTAIGARVGHTLEVEEDLPKPERAAKPAE